MFCGDSKSASGPVVFVILFPPFLLFCRCILAFVVAQMLAIFSRPCFEHLVADWTKAIFVFCVVFPLPLNFGFPLAGFAFHSVSMGWPERREQFVDLRSATAT